MHVRPVSRDLRKQVRAAVALRRPQGLRLCGLAMRACWMRGLLGSVSI
jgi:hypothetical protein